MILNTGWNNALVILAMCGATYFVVRAIVFAWRAGAWLSAIVQEERERDVAEEIDSGDRREL